MRCVLFLLRWRGRFFTLGWFRESHIYTRRGFELVSLCGGQEREVEEWRRVVREDLAAEYADPDGGGNGSGDQRKRWLLGRRRGKKEAQRRGGSEEARREGVEESGRGGGGGGGGGTTGGKRGGLASGWVEDLGGYLSVPEVEISSAEEFMGAFVNKSRPAVIKVTRDHPRAYLFFACVCASIFV